MRYRIRGRLFNRTNEPMIISECIRQKHKMQKNKIYRITINKLDLLLTSTKRFSTSTGPILSIGDNVMNFMWKMDRNYGRLYVKGSIDLSFTEYANARDNYLSDNFNIYVRDIQGKHNDALLMPNEILSYDIVFFSMEY